MPMYLTNAGRSKDCISARFYISFLLDVDWSSLVQVRHWQEHNVFINEELEREPWTAGCGNRMNNRGEELPVLNLDFISLLLHVLIRDSAVFRSCCCSSAKVTSLRALGNFLFLSDSMARSYSQMVLALMEDAATDLKIEAIRIAASMIHGNPNQHGDLQKKLCALVAEGPSPCHKQEVEEAAAIAYARLFQRNQLKFNGMLRGIAAGLVKESPKVLEALRLLIPRDKGRAVMRCGLPPDELLNRCTTTLKFVDHHRRMCFFWNWKGILLTKSFHQRNKR